MRIGYSKIHERLVKQDLFQKSAFAREQSQVQTYVCPGTAFQHFAEDVCHSHWSTTPLFWACPTNVDSQYAAVSQSCEKYSLVDLAHLSFHEVDQRLYNCTWFRISF